MAADRDGGAPVTHACPPDDMGLTPCCGRTPFELPRSDRMTNEPAFVELPWGAPDGC